MTNKQIWTEIAEAFYFLPEQRTERQGNLATCGLCYSYTMQVGNNSLYNAGLVGFWFNGYRIRRNDLRRGDMATLFACMTKREFNRLLASPD